MQSEPAAKPNIWERWYPAWRMMFVSLIGAALILSAVEQSISVGLVLILVGLSIGLGAWFWLGERTLRRIAVVSRWRVALYFMSGWGMWWLATTYGTGYFILLCVLFPHIFILVRLRMGILLAAILNILVLTALDRADSQLTETWMLMMVFGSIVGGFLAFFIDNIISQSGERQHLIAELESAQAELGKSRYEAGVLHERQRLAGEIHDTVTQGLIGVILQLEAAQNGFSGADGQSPTEQALALARDSLREARRLIWSSEPDALTFADFTRHLQAEITSWQTNNGVPCQLYQDGQAESLSFTVGHALLRVVREALNNISRHARASQVMITLSAMSDCVVIDIHDDGSGFMPEKGLNAGFGLKNMRRRVEQLGGTFTLESGIGDGTTIAAELPLNPPAIKTEEGV